MEIPNYLLRHLIKGWVVSHLEVVLEIIRIRRYFSKEIQIITISQLANAHAFLVSKLIKGIVA